MTPVEHAGWLFQTLTGVAPREGMSALDAWANDMYAQFRPAKPAMLEWLFPGAFTALRFNDGSVMLAVGTENSGRPLLFQLDGDPAPDAVLDREFQLPLEIDRLAQIDLSEPVGVISMAQGPRIPPEYPVSAVAEEIERLGGTAPEDLEQQLIDRLSMPGSRRTSVIRRSMVADLARNVILGDDHEAAQDGDSALAALTTRVAYFLDGNGSQVLRNEVTPVQVKAAVAKAAPGLADYDLRDDMIPVIGLEIQRRVAPPGPPPDLGPLREEAVDGLLRRLSVDVNRPEQPVGRFLRVLLDLSSRQDDSVGTEWARSLDAQFQRATLRDFRRLAAEAVTPIRIDDMMILAVGTDRVDQPRLYRSNGTDVPLVYLATERQMEMLQDGNGLLVQADLRSGDRPTTDRPVVEAVLRTENTFRRSMNDAQRGAQGDRRPHRSVLTEFAGNFFAGGLREQPFPESNTMSATDWVSDRLQNPDASWVHRPDNWRNLRALIANAGEGGAVLTRGHGLGDSVYVTMERSVWQFRVDQDGVIVSEPWFEPAALALPDAEGAPQWAVAINHCGDPR
jgi:hypothetical protein